MPMRFPTHATHSRTDDNTPLNKKDGAMAISSCPFLRLYLFTALLFKGNKKMSSSTNQRPSAHSNTDSWRKCLFRLIRKCCRLTTFSWPLPRLVQSWNHNGKLFVYVGSDIFGTCHVLISLPNKQTRNSAPQRTTLFACISPSPCVIAELNCAFWNSRRSASEVEPTHTFAE